MTLVRGVELALHPEGDYVSDAIRSTGDFYEAAILDDIWERIVSGTILDVGAHIGNHAAFFAAFIPRAEIHAFEPVPANLDLLQRNLAPWPAATVHALALGSRFGALRISAPDNLGHAYADPDGEIEARMMPLDLLEFADVSLIKIDVEGYEPKVLAGAAATIARWHPLIVIEDWREEYGPLLPDYRLAAEWREKHQTYLYEAA